MKSLISQNSSEAAPLELLHLGYYGKTLNRDSRLTYSTRVFPSQYSYTFWFFLFRYKPLKLLKIDALTSEVRKYKLIIWKLKSAEGHEINPWESSFVQGSTTISYTGE